ncbi:MAG: hypothetical protein K2X38_20330 [Gemmataceae bacterium]|nr:hypothetical protein [Gemmataceae bacterium]
MKKIDLVREALMVLGEVPSWHIADYIEEKFDVSIPPAVIPILAASVRELDMLERFREQAKSMVQAALPAGKRKEFLQPA